MPFHLDVLEMRQTPAGLFSEPHVTARYARARAIGHASGHCRIRGCNLYHHSLLPTRGPRSSPDHVLHVGDETQCLKGL